MKEKCNPGYYAATNIPIYIPLDNGKQMGWTSNGMPCSFKPTTSSHDYSGIGLGQIGGDRYRISPNHSISYSSFEKQFLERTPTTYTSPNFVPYTQSSQSFLEEPKYINPIISSYTGIAIGLLPKDVNQLKSQAKTKLDNLTADIAIRLSQGKHPQHDQIIGKLLKELKSEADRIKSEAITPSDRLRADILIQEAWKTDAELHLLIAVKNNDHGEHGIEFRNKQLSEYDKEIHKLTKELIAEADRIKGEAITQSDRLRSDILIQEAWKTDAEWHRREAVKNNDHGVHGIEFRNNQLSEYDKEIYRLTKALIAEADKIKAEAITLSDRLRADILIQEAWKTDAEWHRREAVKNNDHGVHGIEFRNNQLPEYVREIHRLTKALIAEADRIKSEAITPSDHLRADILIQEAWKTDAEWHRREAVKNNDHGVHGIEFRNSQLPAYDKEIHRLIKDFTKNNADVNLSGLNINDNVAQLIADSLSKGEMPNLKKLRLEGNKITDKGEDALINALKNETVQDVIITAITLYEKYQLNVSGNKEKQRSILENQLERARSHGVDVDNVVVDKTAWGWIKNKTNFNINIALGWTKCFISYDDIESFAGERLLAKASKRLSWVNDAKDGVLCYFEAENEALLTESGVRDIKYQLLEVQETPELIGNIETWYDFLPL